MIKHLKNKTISVPNGVEVLWMADSSNIFQIENKSFFLS
jgi:hypothetical protein